MTITHGAWIRDRRDRPVLQLRLDGQPAHIRSAQRGELTRRGIVQGIPFFAREWSAPAARRFMRGAIQPGIGAADLAGCTDDPRVFALHQDMCRAIAAGTWRPGPVTPGGAADGRDVEQHQA
jgi:hypothetical protein